MRILVSALFLSCLTTNPVQAAEVRWVERETTIAVCIAAAGPAHFLQGAEQIASLIYAPIGIGIQWLHGRNCPAAAIEITVTFDRPDTFHPRSLGSANPNDGRNIEVFANRLNVVSESRRIDLLGHVFAHEIGHILEGMARHSATGLMKADWNEQDYRAMEQHLLMFTVADVGLIRAGVARREATLIAATSERRP